MKIIQNDNRMEIHANSLNNITVGLIFTAVGLFIAIYFYHYSKSLAPILFGCIFTIVGVGLILFSKKRTIIIEKEGMTTVTDRNIIIRRQPSQQSIPTTDIVGISLSTYMQQNRDPDGNNSRTRSSTLSLLLKNNDLIKIENSTNSGGFSMSGINFGGIITKAPLSKEAEQIATFLGVPLKANDYS